VVPVTQQLSDRGYVGNGTFDQQLGREMQERLDQEVESYVLGQVIANGEEVTGATEFKLVKFLEDVAKCREKLTDTAGVRLKPIVMFTTSDLFNYVTRQCEASTERPMFTLPLNTPGFPKDSNADSEPGQSDPVWSRYQGIQMPGSVVWMTSEGMPTKGTTTQTAILVSAPEKAVVLFESSAMCEVCPSSTLANSGRLCGCASTAGS
jgi:hypothetical protein